MLIRIAISLVLALILAACTTEGDFKLPGVYRIDIQQGNIVEQDMLSKLKPGMDQNQVRFIMGTPVLVDPFHTDRWEYVFIYSEGGTQREQRHITVHFKDQKLSYVDGDIVVAERKPVDDLKPQQAPIDVPLSDNRPGFFSRMFNALPFVGEKEAGPAKPAAGEQSAEPAAAAGAGADEGAAPGQPAAVPEAGGADQPATGSAEPADQDESGGPSESAGAPETDQPGADEAGSEETNPSAPPADEGTETGSSGTDQAPGSDEGAWPVEPRAPSNNVPGWPAEPLPAPGEEPPQPDSGGSGTPH